MKVGTPSPPPPKYWNTISPKQKRKEGKSHGYENSGSSVVIWHSPFEAFFNSIALTFPPKLNTYKIFEILKFFITFKIFTTTYTKEK